MSIVVLCPSCQQRSKVAESALGMVVACPHCAAQFVAEPNSSVPTVRPRNPTSVPTVRPRSISRMAVEEIANRSVLQPELSDSPHEESSPPTGWLVALSLFPLGIPLVWLAVTQLAQRQPEFSFTLPVAIGASFTGLCLGLANARRWSLKTRLFGVCLLLLIAVLLTVLLYSLQRDHMEKLREVGNKGHSARVQHEPDASTLKASDLSYKVSFPGKPEAVEQAVPGLQLKAVRYVDVQFRWEDEFIAGHGHLTGGFVPLNDQAWFDRVKEILLQGTSGKLVYEDSFVMGLYPGRRFVLEIPSEPSKRMRIVRVVRAGTQIIYLSIEGAYLSKDNKVTTDFLNSLRLVPQR